MRSGVAAVIIGNEVLSAKVREKNGSHLIERLAQRGTPLRLMMFVPDEIDAIVEAVSRARKVASFVITSGGIGPTHDDVTVRAVALALGRKVVRVPELAEDVQRHYGDRVTPAALRLADAPEGAELITRDGSWYPVLACEGVFMLPGVPSLFKVQLESVLPRIPGTPLYIRSLYLRLGESESGRRPGSGRARHARRGHRLLSPVRARPRLQGQGHGRVDGRRPGRRRGRAADPDLARRCRAPFGDRRAALPGIGCRKERSFLI